MSLTYEKQVLLNDAVAQWQGLHSHKVAWTLQVDLASPHGVVQVSPWPHWSTVGHGVTPASAAALTIIRRFAPFHAMELAFAAAEKAGQRAH